VALNAIRRTIIGVGCALSMVLPSAEARAAISPRPSVLVVRPDATDPSLAEALTRIEAELRVAGFDVTIADGESANVELQHEHGPAAIIGIFGDALTGLEFRIANRRTGQMVIRRMAPEGETGKRAPEILAIYAVELLLASLAELDITPASPEPGPPPPPPSPAPVPAPAPPARREDTPAIDPATEPSRFGIESGVGVAVSTGGVGPALLPIARFQYAVLPIFHVRLTGAGLGTRAEISGDAGTARISQAIVLAEAIARPYQGKWVSPSISFGAGTHYFGVEGRAAPPLAGQSASLWSAALDLGVGVSSARSSLFEFALEAHALLAYPYPSIRFIDERKATAGRPTVFITATVVGWL
jgi:hypothetical protein